MQRNKNTFHEMSKGFVVTNACTLCFQTVILDNTWIQCIVWAQTLFHLLIYYCFRLDYDFPSLVETTIFKTLNPSLSFILEDYFGFISQPVCLFLRNNFILGMVVYSFDLFIPSFIILQPAFHGLISFFWVNWMSQPKFDGMFKLVQKSFPWYISERLFYLSSFTISGGSISGSRGSSHVIVISKSPEKCTSILFLPFPAQ